jgi:CubicO group peptidase (beta-lactamase class C family)
MNAHSLRWLFLWVSTFILVITAHAQPPPSPIPDDFVSKAEALIQRYVDDGGFQGVVLVRSAGVTLIRKAYGWSNAEWGVSVTPAAKFRIGSITKQFAAVAVLQLEEQGQLSLIDPITRFYAEAPAEWSNVTIENLLRHTSGIFEYTQLPAFQTRLPQTPAEIIASVHDRPLAFAPGTRFEYSNTGYVLLGLIVERASGLSWAEYVRHNILDKAGLRDIGYDRTERILAQRAAGYRGDGIHLINADFVDMTLPYSAGALYSTADDLDRWFEALEQGQVITPASFQKMTTPGLGNYGYGLGISQFNGTPAYTHTGGIHGFATAMMRSPSLRYTAVILSNIETAPSNDLRSLIGQLALGRTLTLPPLRAAISLPNATLDAIVGRYRLPDDRIISVTRDEEVLLYRDREGSFEQVVPMWPQSESEFFSRTLPLEFVIQRQGDTVTGIVIRQGNTNTPTTRVP